MKILLLGYMFGQGGIQTHTHYLAKGLTNKGHDVTVLSPPPVQGEKRQIRHGTDYVLKVYKGSPREVLSGFSCHYKSAPDLAVVCGVGWKAMLGVLRLPSTTYKVFFEVMSGSRQGILDPRQLVHFGFDGIIGQASPVEQRFCQEFRWQGPRTSIAALPEPLELSTTIPNRSPQRDGQGTRLVYFGRLVPHKGLSHLLDNWDSIEAPNVTLDIYGTGPQKKELESKIATFNLEKKVRLLGRYPDGADCVTLMQSYDCTVLPTWGDEGAPLVLLESMACGLPFVANGVGGIPDYQNPDCSITSGRLDEFIPALNDMIIRIQRDQVNFDRLQAHYKNNYSFEALVSLWDAHLKDVRHSKIDR